MKRGEAVGLKPEETKPGLLASCPHPGVLSSLPFICEICAICGCLSLLWLRLRREKIVAKTKILRVCVQMEQRSEEMPIGVMKEQARSALHAFWFHPGPLFSPHLCQSVRICGQPAFPFWRTPEENQALRWFRKLCFATDNPEPPRWIALSQRLMDELQLPADLQERF